MNVQIQARHGSISEVTRDKIAAKVEKFGRFDERVAGVDVVVNLEQADRPHVEIIVVTELKHDFRADYESGDLYGCVDQCVEKVVQQMRKFKEKLHDHRVKEEIQE